MPTSTLPRKRARPRAWKTARCVSRGCRKPQSHIERCVPHAKKYLDGLWGARVRTDRCEVAHHDLFACGGPVQACHGFDRDEIGTRWDLRNGLSGCAASNAYFHVHKRQWYAYLRDFWGMERYNELAALADHPKEIDYDAVLASLLESETVLLAEGVAYNVAAWDRLAGGR